MTYTLGIPVATHTPSADYQNMATNCNLLNSGFGTNHVPFTDGTSTNIGKHNFVTVTSRGNYPNNDPAITQLAVDGNFYTQTTNSVAVPFFRNYTINTGAGANIYAMPLAIVVQVAVAKSSSPQLLYDFSSGNFTAMSGTVLVYDNASPSRTIVSPFVWNGTTVFVPGQSPLLSGKYPGQLISGTTFVNLVTSGSQLQLQTDNSSAFTVNVKFIGTLV